MSKHYLRKFPPIICPKCGGEAFLETKENWDGYVLSVQCEFCSNREEIECNICDNCPNRTSD